MSHDVSPHGRRDGHGAAHGHDHGPEAGHGHRHEDEHRHGHHGGPDGDQLPALLDLDAEVAHSQLAALTAHIAELTGPVGHLLDVGSGTGTGTFALLRRFPDAIATTVDTSAEMLRHLTESATAHGVADRIRAVRADLDAGWPAVEPADLVWASSSMHHLADPVRVLRDIRATLRPGGLFVMIEMEAMPRFLPPGFANDLEDRCLSAAAEAKAEHLPHIGADWTARLADTGFTVLEQRTLTVEIPAPLPANAVRYATAVLGRYRTGLADRLSATDRDALDSLLEPGSLAAHSDLSLRSPREVWLAR